LLALCPRSLVPLACRAPVSGRAHSAPPPPHRARLQQCEAVRGRLAKLSIDASVIDTEETAVNTATLHAVTNAPARPPVSQRPGSRLLQSLTTPRDRVASQITELLRLHDEGRAAADARGEELCAAEREISVQNRALEALRDEVTSAEDAGRKWRLQLDMAREEHRAEKSKLAKQNKDLEKERARLQGKDTQYVAKLRKAEGESNRLKDQLQKAQNPTKGRKERGAIAMVRVLPAATRSVSGRRAGGDEAASDAQRLLDEAHAAYTETLSELRSENECLRASLQTLQEELTDACNDAVAPKRVLTADGKEQEEDVAGGGAMALQGTMLLPVEFMQDGMEQQIRQLVQGVRELLSSAAAAAAEKQQGPMESPSIAQKATASLVELRDQLSAEIAEGVRLQKALDRKSDRLIETERMCALLRDQAHKQLGSSAAAEAIKEREEACEQRERALEAEAVAVAEQAESNAAAAEQIDRQRAGLEADTAAVAASLSAWERGSVGPDGTPLAAAGKENAAAASPTASPNIAQFLRRLSGISAPSSASKGSPAAGGGGGNAPRSARKSAKMTITPHKTSTTLLPMFSPKVCTVPSLYGHILLRLRRNPAVATWPCSTLTAHCAAV
jgi:hypothetical protein